ncbi:alpha/beta hydrolase [Aquamicrobium lusatiense]|uniref:alpha/beta fold hydrolase n=1 Tax=Aquamicrobium lusatiense TaxID=89772 RepID=UPI0024540E69|nr:alpha/beta hydrolase [Aquamicrobium lusatiense]MDH4989322.1 alpha/beta hydrolase [Aquamicrobium lusatiense]
MFAKFLRRIRWHYVDVVARLGIGDEEILRQGRRPAYGKAQPRLLTVTQGAEPFSAHDALHGSWSTPEQSPAIPNSLWVEIDGAAECIRYYPSGLRDSDNRVALVFLSGDVVLRTPLGIRYTGPTYARQTPDHLTGLMAEWSADAGAAAIYLARPGIFGSSGDHEKRRLPYEIDLMDRSLDLLKEKHRIGRFILVGQSGGAQIAAALLNRRRDITASVMTSGLLSVHQTVSRWRRFRPVPGGAVHPVEALCDPMQDISRIPRRPAPTIILISDPRDAAVPLHSQLQYLRKLVAEGLKPHHIYAHAQGPKRHNLGLHGRKAAALIARGADIRQIRQALVDLDLDNLGESRKSAKPIRAAAAED